MFSKRERDDKHDLAFRSGSVRHGHSEFRGGKFFCVFCVLPGRYLGEGWEYTSNERRGGI